MVQIQHFNSTIILVLVSVLIDETPPLSGRVSDGASLDEDVDYTSDVVSVAAVWESFSDPESLLKDYSVDVYRTPPGRASSFSSSFIITTVIKCVCTCKD